MGNFELKQILAPNGVEISEPEPVSKNTAPENVLSEPKQKSSPREKQIKVASAQVKTGKKALKSRQKQGTALINLARQNGIEIPNPEVIALERGSTKAVQKWRDNLMQAGIFNSQSKKESVREDEQKLSETRLREENIEDSKVRPISSETSQEKSQSLESTQQFSEKPTKTKPQETPKNNAIYGRNATAITDSKTKNPVRYKVVEANELSTHH